MAQSLFGYSYLTLFCIKEYISFITIGKEQMEAIDVSVIHRLALVCLLGGLYKFV